MGAHAKERPRPIDMVGTVVSPHLISCASPTSLAPNARALVSLSLNSGHDFTEPLPFVVKNAPVLTSVHPSCGTLAGGTPVKIRGRNFTDSKRVAVRFSIASMINARDARASVHLDEVHE